MSVGRLMASSSIDGVNVKLLRPQGVVLCCNGCGSARSSRWGFRFVEHLVRIFVQIKIPNYIHFVGLRLVVYEISVSSSVLHLLSLFCRLRASTECQFKLSTDCSFSTPTTLFVSIKKSRLSGTVFIYAMIFWTFPVGSVLLLCAVNAAGQTRFRYRSFTLHKLFYFFAIVKLYD